MSGACAEGGLSRGARGAGATGSPGSSTRPSSRRGILQPAGGRHAMCADTRGTSRDAARHYPVARPRARCEGRFASVGPRQSLLYGGASRAGGGDAGGQAQVRPAPGPGPHSQRAEARARRGARPPASTRSWSRLGSSSSSCVGISRTVPVPAITWATGTIWTIRWRQGRTPACVAQSLRRTPTYVSYVCPSCLLQPALSRMSVRGPLGVVLTLVCLQCQSHFIQTPSVDNDVFCFSNCDRCTCDKLIYFFK